MSKVRILSSIHPGKIFQSITEMRVSLQIILLLCLLGFSVISGSFLAINQLKIFRHDGFAINNLGVIRGSIQRITKREINQIQSDELISEVNSTFRNVKSKYFIDDVNTSYLQEDNVIDNYEALELSWSELKSLISDYRINKASAEQLLLQSELCWQKADFIVFSVQKINEKKHSHYRNLIILILVILSSIISAIIILVHTIVHNSLEVDAITDPLTKLYNRKYFSKVLDRQIKLSKRYDYSFSLILYDIDHFKRINDEFGHPTGDRVLIQLATLLKEHGRDVDDIFRLGGEEFAIIAPESNLSQAVIIAEKYRALTEKADFAIGHKITISAGVSQLTQRDNKESLYKRTDSALYKAKSCGRNCVIASESESAV